MHAITKVVRNESPATVTLEADVVKDVFELALPVQRNVGSSASGSSAAIFRVPRKSGAVADRDEGLRFGASLGGALCAAREFDGVVASTDMCARSLESSH